MMIEREQEARLVEGSRGFEASQRIDRDEEGRLHRILIPPEPHRLAGHVKAATLVRKTQCHVNPEVLGGGPQLSDFIGEVERNSGPRGREAGASASEVATQQPSLGTCFARRD